MQCYMNTDEARKWRHDFRVAISKVSDEFVCKDPTLYFSYENNTASEQEIMRYDLRGIKNSALVCVNLKDIYKSVGTIQELMYAYLHDIPVIAFCDEAIELHPWLLAEIDRVEFGSGAMYQAIQYIMDYYL